MWRPIFLFLSLFSLTESYSPSNDFQYFCNVKSAYPAIVAIGTTITCQLQVKRNYLSGTVTVDYGNSLDDTFVVNDSDYTKGSTSTTGTVYNLTASSDMFILKHLSSSMGQYLTKIEFFALQSDQPVEFGILDLDCYRQSTCLSNINTYKESIDSTSYNNQWSQTFTTTYGLNSISISPIQFICNSFCLVYFKGDSNLISQNSSASNSNYDMFWETENSTVIAIQEFNKTNKLVNFNVKLTLQKEYYYTNVTISSTYSAYQNYTITASMAQSYTTRDFDIVCMPQVYMSVSCPEKDIIAGTPTNCIVQVCRPVAVVQLVLTLWFYDYKVALSDATSNYLQLDGFDYYNETVNIIVTPRMSWSVPVDVTITELPYADATTQITPRYDFNLELYCDKTGLVNQTIQCQIFITTERQYLFLTYRVDSVPYTLSVSIDPSNNIGVSKYNASKSVYFQIVSFNVSYPQEGYKYMNLTTSDTYFVTDTYITIYPILKVNCTSCQNYFRSGVPKNFYFGVYTILANISSIYIDYGDSIPITNFNCSFSVNNSYTGSRNYYDFDSIDSNASNETSVLDDGFEAMPNDLYFMVHTIFEKEIYIRKIKFIATRLGSVTFKVVNFLFCGVKTDCFNYLQTNYASLGYSYTIKRMTVLKEWTYEITELGVNELNLDTDESHFPASSMLAWQSNGGQIQVMVSEDNYPDLYYTNDDHSNLTAVKNDTYIFNLLVVGQLYFLTYTCNDTTKAYYYAGSFNVTYNYNGNKNYINWASSSDGTPNATVSCVNTTLRQGDKFTCYLYSSNMVYQTSFSLNCYDLSTLLNYNAYSADYFGSAFGNSVEATSTQPSLSASPKSYLLMSSTFLANAQLTGILINGKTAGSISLKMIKFTGCNSYKTCLTYLTGSSSFSYQTLKDYGDKNFNESIQNITLWDYRIWDAGSMLLMKIKNGSIYLENTGSTKDLLVVSDTGSSLNLTQITSDGINWRFCIQLWFQRGYYSSYTAMTSPMVIVQGIFNLTTTISSSNTFPTAVVYKGPYNIKIQVLDGNFTTTTTSTTTTTGEINSLFSITSYSTSDSTQLATVVDLLSSNYTGDLSGCLSNCSNQGVCSINSASEYVCKCSDYYTGVKCQIDSRPCSSTPCLNNGNCSNVIDNSTGTYKSYSCDCGPYYYGANCEKIVSLCSNYSCSGHGSCKETSNGPNCTCFQYYSGAHCEEQSAKMAAIQTMVSIASTIAIIFIVMLYVILFVSDLHTAIFLNKAVAKTPEKKPDVKKFKYRNPSEKNTKANEKKNVSKQSTESTDPFSQFPDSYDFDIESEGAQASFLLGTSFVASSPPASVDPQVPSLTQPSLQVNQVNASDDNQESSPIVNPETSTEVNPQSQPSNETQPAQPIEVQPIEKNAPNEVQQDANQDTQNDSDKDESGTSEDDESDEDDSSENEDIEQIDLEPENNEISPPADSSCSNNLQSESQEPTSRPVTSKLPSNQYPGPC